MGVKVYGASDDLIEIDGDIHEEFGVDSDEVYWLAFTDGTILRVQYGDDGVWRITRHRVGMAKYQKIENDGADSDNYSDVVVLDGNIKSVVCGKMMADADRGD